MTDLFDKDAEDQLTRERGICLEANREVKKMVDMLRQCEKRVNSKSYTAETCSQEVVDLVEALDHCVGAKAFKQFA